MTDKYSYACADYPGMEDCPGKVTAASREEVWKLMALHATEAHGEDPAAWSDEDKKFLSGLIKAE